MTFWKFSTLWFVSLNTQRYLPRTFLGSCLNYLIHIPWFYLSEIKSVGLVVDIGTTFWKNVTKCHASADTAACQIQSPMTALLWLIAIALNPSSGVRIFRPGVTLFRVFTSMIQDTGITLWNLLKLCNCNSMTLKYVLNFSRNVWARFCFMWDMVVLKPAMVPQTQRS